MKKLLLPTATRIIKAIDHNRWLFMAVLMTMALSWVTVGCQPRTTSPFSNSQVTWDELEVEASKFLEEINTQQSLLQARIDAKAEQLDDAYEALERKQNAIRSAMQTINDAVVPYAGPYGGLLTTGLGLLGLGLGFDNRKKDNRIKQLKAEKA